MAQIAHAYAQLTTAQTNATTAYADVVSLAAGNFTTAKKYLLWATAQVSCSTTTSSHRPNVRVKHGSTPFDDSLRYVLVGAANRYNDYHWFGVWTAGASESVAMEFSSGNAAATATIDQATLLAICLSDDLTEGVHWHFNESGADLNPLVLNTPTAGAAITFTPPSAGNKWLVASLAQTDATATTNSIFSLLDRTGEATALLSECGVEAGNATNHRDQLLNVVPLTLGAVSNTFTENSEARGSANTGIRLNSKVFALNLSRFEAAEFAHTAAATGDLTATYTEAQTLSVTPLTAGPVWVGGFFGMSVGTAGVTVGYRLQVDNADEPATQTADAYTASRGGDARDRATWHIQGLPTLTAAVHNVDLDVANPGNNSGTNAAQYRSIWAVSMELDSGGAAPPPDVTSLGTTTGEQGTLVDVGIVGTGFASGAVAAFGAGITVNSTTFVNSASLTANITIAAGASLGLRSVVVTNPDAQADTLVDSFTVVAPNLQLWSDDFNRANGTLGANWNSAGWAIAANAVTTANADAYWASGNDRTVKSPDYYARVRISTLSATADDYVAIGARDFDGSSGYFARIIRKAGTDELEVAIRNGSTTFTRLAFVAHEWVAGHYLEIRVDGNTITARVLDGALAQVATVSATDSVWQEVVGSITLRAGSASSTVDDFSAGWLRTQNLSHVTAGAVTSTTARIAFAVTHASTVKVRYSTTKSGGALVSPTTTAGVAVDSTTDRTGKIDITGLAAGTTYHYQVLVDDVAQNLDTASLAFPKFKTAQANTYSGQLKIAFGSCHQGNGEVMDAIANKAPDLWLLQGDILYSEDFGGGPGTLDEYRHAYRIVEQAGIRGVPHSGTLNHLRRRTRREFPSLYQRDDHEEFGGTAADVNQALLEHLLRGNPDSPTAGALYYPLRFGPVELFVLDTRSHRGATTLLGATQITWLKAALSASTATFKIICSSGPVMPYAEADSWGSDSDYIAERDDLFDYIAANDITGHMWWTGDRHISGAYLNKRYTAGTPGTHNYYEYLSSPVDSPGYPVPADAQSVRPVAQSGATRSAGVATITTGIAGSASVHGLVVGETVVVSGVSDTTFNGTFTVTAVPTTTTVSYAQAGQPDVAAATAGGGAIEAQHIQWQVGGQSQQFAVATFDTSVSPPSVSISSYDETGTLLTARTPGGGSTPATLVLTTYDIDGAPLTAQQDLTGTYTVLVGVEQSLAAAYSVAASTTSDLAAAYAVLGTVVSDMAASYALHAAVQADAPASYAVLGTVQADLSGTYDVETASAVSTDLLASYAIHGAVSTDLVAGYEVADTITSDLVGGYSVLGSTQVDLLVVYDILTAGSVVSDLAAAYSVLGVVSADSVLSFDILSSTQADLAGSYAVLSAAQADLVAAYEIAGSVVADLFASFGVAVASTVKRALILRNGLLAEILSSEVGTGKKPVVLLNGVLKERAAAEGIAQVMGSGGRRDIATNEVLSH